MEYNSKQWQATRELHVSSYFMRMDERLFLKQKGDIVSIKLLFACKWVKGILYGNGR